MSRQELRTEKDLYREYLELYKKAPCLDKFEDLDDTWKVFKCKKGLPVKYVDLNEWKEIIPMDTNLVGEGRFYHKNAHFYLIPNEIGKTIVSFVLRGLQHDYADYLGVSQLKPLFGIFSFKDYKRGTPIILTEGAKDCISLQMAYPFSLAILGVGVTRKNAKVLKALTNKLILAYDNDKTGSAQFCEDASNLRKLGFNILKLKCPKKDFGECIGHDFSAEIQNLIKAFPAFSIKS